MTLGRRFGVHTGSSQDFDPDTLVIQITGSKTHSGTTYWDYPNDITVLQDPHNFIGPTAYTTGFGLRKATGIYTMKLSTIQGGWTSDDSYFDFNIEAQALPVGDSNHVVNQTNVTPRSSSPIHTTEKLGPEDPTNLNDGVQDWEYTSPAISGDIGDFQFYATDRNPGETPTPNPDMAILLFATGGGTSPMTITADVILEITRSDI